MAAEAVLPLGVAGQERDWWSLLPCEVAGRREATSVMTEPPSDHVVRTDAGRPAGGSRAGRTAARTCGSFSHTVVRSGTAFRTRLVNRARLGVGGEAREEASRRSTFYWRRTAAPRAPRGDQSRPHFQVQVQIFSSTRKEPSMGHFALARTSTHKLTLLQSHGSVTHAFISHARPPPSASRGTILRRRRFQIRPRSASCTCLPLFLSPPPPPPGPSSRCLSAQTPLRSRSGHLLRPLSTADFLLLATVPRGRRCAGVAALLCACATHGTP